jgi:lipid-binding SYLF domain-containing protein
LSTQFYEVFLSGSLERNFSVFQKITQEIIMSHYTRILLFVVLISISFPYQAFAIGDTLSGLATSTGDMVKGVGHQVGIGVPATQTDKEVSLSLDKLLKNSAVARDLSKKAKAILVFPRIVKAGLGIGGHYGEGALLKDGKTVAYYNTAAGSYGLQIGAQVFGYAMFFMDDKGLNYLLENNTGWEVGVGPSVVFIDEGMAKTVNNTTLTESVYVFTFNQRGLMAGAGIQGSKITRMNP